MEKYILDCYPIFSKLISEDEFLRITSSLGIYEQKKFIRACLMYNRANGCIRCDGNVSIALLCSTVETVSSGANIIFKDWIVRHKLNELSDKTEKQLKTLLNRAYHEYLDSETNREGISFNFREFLKNYCPEELKKPPIEMLNGDCDLFNIAIRAIYSNFRSLYLHEAIDYLSPRDTPIIDKETGSPIKLISDFLILEVGSKVVNVKLNHLTGWFSNVVKHSLFQYLKRITISP
jgi:hypothetical protein